MEGIGVEPSSDRERLIDRAIDAVPAAVLIQDETGRLLDHVSGLPRPGSVATFRGFPGSSVTIRT